LKELGNDLPKERHISLFEEEGTLALVEIKDIGREMGTAVTTEMIFGGIPEIILESAKQSNLLALGRRGNRHEKHSQHLGSNFRQIEHHAHIPLLIGGSEPTQEELNRVLLAYNGNDLSRSALNWVEGLQTIFTDIIVLSVKTKNEPGSAWLEKRQEEISKSTLGHWDFVGMEGEPGPIITSTALARQADLIVMGAYRHRQLIEWASHRTLNYVLSNIDLPIMAIK
jgi:nucleotide-binding universal stress UspA family protein